MQLIGVTERKSLAMAPTPPGGDITLLSMSGGGRVGKHLEKQKQKWMTLWGTWAHRHMHTRRLLCGVHI
jgi:hypothetical protein